MAKVKHGKPEGNTNVTVMDAGEPITKRPLSRRKLAIVLSVIAGIIIVVLGGMAYRNHTDSVAARNAADQKLTQTNLDAALQSGDQNGTVQSAMLLINGVNSHRFKLSKSELAHVYLEKAAAEGDQREYSQGLNSYAAAIKIDSSVKLPALQGEVSLQNAAGNKQALIPLLQQLVKLEQNSTQPFAASDAAHYQAVIQAIQHNQEYDL